MQAISDNLKNFKNHMMYKKDFKLKLHALDLWFLNLSCRNLNTAHFLCLPNQTHLIQLITWVNELMS